MPTTDNKEMLQLINERINFLLTHSPESKPVSRLSSLQGPNTEQDADLVMNETSQWVTNKNAKEDLQHIIQDRISTVLAKGSLGQKVDNLLAILFDDQQHGHHECSQPVGVDLSARRHRGHEARIAPESLQLKGGTH